MKKTLINFLQAGLNVIGSLGIFLLIIPALAIGPQLFGLPALYFMNSPMGSFISSYILHSANFFIGAIGTGLKMLGNIPIIRSIPIVNLIFRAPSFILQPILNFVSAIPATIFGIPSLIAAPLVGIGTFIAGNYAAKAYLGDEGISGSLYNKFKNYKKNFLIKELKRYSQSKGLIDYLNKKLEYYRNHSILPFLASLLAGAGIFTGLSLFALPAILPTIAATLGYLFVRNTVFNRDREEKINDFLHEKLPDSNKTTLATIGLYAATPFIALYKSGGFKEIIHSIINNTLSTSAFAARYSGKILPVISTITAAISLFSIWGDDKDSRGKFHRIFNSSIKTFSFSLLAMSGLAALAAFNIPLTIPLLITSITTYTKTPTLAVFALGGFVALTIFNIPLAAPLLAVSIYTTIESGFFSAGSFLGMTLFDRDNIGKAFRDFKNFIFKDTLPLMGKTFGALVGESLVTGGGFMAGSFLGSLIGLPNMLFRGATTLIGGLIGFITGKNLSEEYLSVTEDEPSKSESPSTIPAPIVAEPDNKYVKNLENERADSTSELRQV